DAALAASDLEWTIVRPGPLTDAPGTGRIEAGPSLGRGGSITRDDVAAVLVGCLDEPHTVRAAFDVLQGQTPIAQALASLWAGPSVGAGTSSDVLLELRVENLLLIERAELRLAPGLNVLTGETGAGKTVLAYALDLLLGGRARPGIVRPGAAEAYVEGVFELPARLRGELGERLPEDAEEVVLARRVSAEGRTRAYVNGQIGRAAGRERGEGG